jgi:hypothetical protein
VIAPLLKSAEIEELRRAWLNNAEQHRGSYHQRNERAFLVKIPGFFACRTCSDHTSRSKMIA